MKRPVLAVFSALLLGLVVLGVLAVDTPVAQAATSGGSVKKCGGGSISLNADEKKTFALHNKERRDRNLKPLCVHPDLQRAARSHSKDMIRRDYFSHNTKGRNQNACERIRSFGYRYHLCGENIAYGSGPYGAPESIMRGWMKSDGHRRNILKGKFREVGIGTYTGTYKGTPDVTMYTADFGTRG